MSPEYVRPYVEANKNDDRDAEAIAEAATRPTMRFVPVKSEMQSDIQALLNPFGTGSKREGYRLIQAKVFLKRSWGQDVRSAQVQSRWAGLR